MIHQLTIGLVNDYLGGLPGSKTRLVVLDDTPPVPPSLFSISPFTPFLLSPPPLSSPLPRYKHLQAVVPCPMLILSERRIS